MRFRDKVALVTGAGSGIGKATATHLAKEGAKVALLGDDETGVYQLADELGQSNSEALPLVADVSDPQKLQTSFDKLLSHWPQLDLVVANAGVNGVWAPVEELRYEEWQRTLAVNLTGTFLTIKYAAAWLKKSRGAAVIVSSVNGTRCFSTAGACAYSTSKAGQVAFMKMMALELAKDGVRVNAVCPGAIDTDIDQSTLPRDLDRVMEPAQLPLGGIPLTNGIPGTADQVAELILFLLSSSASHITGSEIWIDGAGSLLQG